jgi:molybdate transport system substrate-binding protein
LRAVLAELGKPGIRHLAIGDPASVPAGTYAKEYLVKLGLWDTLGKKLVPLESVRSVLAAVEAGNAEAGFVYRTDALVSRKVRVAVEIPQDQGPRIHYPGAVLNNAPQPEAAEAFLTWLQGPVAQAAFTKYGFIVVK